MKVMKFGGTSLGSPEAMTRCAELVEREIKLSQCNPVVIVSAHSKVTDKLLDAAKKAARTTSESDIDESMKTISHRHYEILDGLKLPRSIAEKNLAELRDLLKGIHYVKEVTPRLYDYVTSFGERLSSKCFAALLRSRGHESAEAINAYDLNFVTDSKFMNARPLPETYEKIAEAFKPHAKKLVVVTGFIAKDKNGDITTIGRSGSDFSAAIFGAALKADEIQVWKDVPGVMTCDPTLIKTARPLARLSFEEASELAYYGAEVLHPSTMVPAMMHDIPVRVLHTFNPDAPGTLITTRAEIDSKYPIKCIVYKEDQVLINVRSERMLGMEGFMARLFAIFERHHVVIDMISTSEVSVSLTTNTTDEHKLESLMKDLDELCAPHAATHADPHVAEHTKKVPSKVVVQKEKCIVAVVGEGMKHTVGLASRTFKAVAAAGVSLQMISQGASEINITFLIDNKEIPAACSALHKEYFGS